MRFEWDLKKSAANCEKHGVSFEEAIFAFYDPHAWIETDFSHSNEREIRERLMGEASPGILVVVFTVRDAGEIHRIISARKANRKERRFYEKAKRF